MARYKPKEIFTATVCCGRAATKGGFTAEERWAFESAGFEKAADTTSRLDGFPRVLMRLALS